MTLTFTSKGKKEKVSPKIYFMKRREGIIMSLRDNSNKLDDQVFMIQQFSIQYHVYTLYDQQKYSSYTLWVGCFLFHHVFLLQPCLHKSSFIIAIMCPEAGCLFILIEEEIKLSITLVRLLKQHITWMMQGIVTLGKKWQKRVKIIGLLFFWTSQC